MTELDRRSTRPLATVLTLFIVVSTGLSVLSTAVGYRNQARLDDRDADIVQLIEVTQQSRVKSAKAFCTETEAIKTGIRTVLDSEITREQQREQGIAGLFTRYDCDVRSRVLVKPLPPLPNP